MTSIGNPKTERDQDRIFVRLMSQVSLQVAGENIFRELQERVLKWAFNPKRNIRGVPPEAWDGKSFDIDAPNSERASAIALDNPKYWAFRLSERLKDSNRIWITEVGIAERQDGSAVFGCRLVCSERGHVDSVPRTLPSFVRGIAFTQSAMLDGRRTSPDPWIVNEDNLPNFLKFLTSPHRLHPIVVFSLPEGSEDESETLIPVEQFIRRTVGFVHTVVLTSSASYGLTDAYGREFAAYRQAIRTFYPGFDPEQDLPSDHPVATAARIEGWTGSEQQSFEDFLVHQSLRPSRTRDELEKAQPTFQQLRQIAASQARRAAEKSGKSDGELLELALEEAEAARAEARDSLELAINAEAERDQAKQELLQTNARYIALQARLKNLQTSIEEAEPSKTPVPDTFDYLEEWATAELAGEIELHERAVKAARKSNFLDPKLAFEALLVMRDYYIPMRREGGIEKKEAFEQKLAELGLENTPCFNQDNKAKQFGGQYFVRFDGASRELDWHLKGSSSRDVMRGFRLYYFWDELTSRVVVGHFPTHLKTDAS